MLKLEGIKKEFPIFTKLPSLVYLDSAATGLKPRTVIEREQEYLREYSANIARGLYPIAETATEKFEAVREKLARFIGAQTEEIVFTANTTDAINLAADLLSQKIEEGNIVTTAMEHHSNYLPWKELAKKKGLDFRIAPLTAEGALDRTELRKLVNAETRVVAMAAVSNVLGNVQPVQEIITEIKKLNPDTLVLVDAAQAIGHSTLDVKAWGADFVAFSAHKMFGPTGVGALYGKAELLQTFAPVRFGGGMVLDACAENTQYKESPFRFEAGTPNIAGVIAWGAALEFIESIGLEAIRAHEITLSRYAQTKLENTFGDDIKILGPKNPEERGGVLAFTLANLHPHDIAHILGEKNICIRAGEHCAAPLHRSLGLPATARASFSVYNNEDDIDSLIEGLKEALTLISNT